ncbi:MAG: hypothetical protein HY015_07810 [Bacteroidetes bacterium]|nr:hypothetical protein [Bacteroidota bacterium]MBI3482864.1 hypothetical protein [Bacteroidota bacterium]
MKTLELENWGISELNLSEALSIDGGDSNGTMAGGSISLDWTKPVINFVAGFIAGVFS